MFGRIKIYFRGSEVRCIATSPTALLSLHAQKTYTLTHTYTHTHAHTYTRARARAIDGFGIGHLVL